MTVDRIAGPSLPVVALACLAVMASCKGDERSTPQGPSMATSGTREERDAELATLAEIDWARRLFNGNAPLSNGGPSCASCHSILDHGETIGGGSLGPNLTGAYLKYRERGLTLFLKQPCFRRGPEDPGEYLTPAPAIAMP